MTDPVPLDGTVRVKDPRQGPKEFSVYRDGKWRPLKSQKDVDAAIAAAPVMIPWSYDMAPGGERIIPPPLDGPNPFRR